MKGKKTTYMFDKRQDMYKGICLGLGVAAGSLATISIVSVIAVMKYLVS